MMDAVCWRIPFTGDFSSRSLVSGTVSTRCLEYLLEFEYRTDNQVFCFGFFLVYMRKVKFTQDLFDMKLGGILSEFPILDVSLAPFPAHPPLGHTAQIRSHMPHLILGPLLIPHISPSTPFTEPPPLPLLPPQRPLRQESLQARSRSAQHGPTLDRSGRKGLRQVVEVWRQSV
jgi:hypothetical protein